MGRTFSGNKSPNISEFLSVSPNIPMGRTFSEIENLLGSPLVA
jgi:hypothetical protein